MYYIQPAPSKTSRVRPRVQIVRLRAMLAHILVDPSEELFQYIGRGGWRPTDEGGKTGRYRK